MKKKSNKCSLPHWSLAVLVRRNWFRHGSCGVTSEGLCHLWRQLQRQQALPHRLPLRLFPMERAVPFVRHILSPAQPC